MSSPLPLPPPPSSSASLSGRAARKSSVAISKSPSFMADTASFTNCAYVILGMVSSALLFRAVLALGITFSFSRYEFGWGSELTCLCAYKEDDKCCHDQWRVNGEE